MIINSILSNHRTLPSICETNKSFISEPEIEGFALKLEIRGFLILLKFKFIILSLIFSVAFFRFALEFNRRGGVGIISVTANIAPKLCSDFQKYSKSKTDNEIKEAERIDQILQPIHKSLFIESNPAPVKYAAKLLGLCGDEIRLPLVKIKKETEDQVTKALLSAKLLS